MNLFLSILSKVLVALPTAIQTVELFANHRDSMTKKEMAHVAAMNAADIASVVVDPKNKPIVDAVSSVVSNSIDLTVQAANAVGAFSHKSTLPTTPAPEIVPAEISTAAAVAEPVAAAAAPAPAPVAKKNEAPAATKVKGPGLHSVVPA